MTRRLFAKYCGMGLVAPVCVTASDGRQLLEEVARRYQGLKSYYFVGKTLSQSTLKGKTSETEIGFTIAFQAPSKFRIEFRYATAGNWLRVSNGTAFLERRSLTNESKVTPVTGGELRALHSSPTYNFERLSQTAVNPMIMRTESIEVDGKKVECDLVQFEAGRRQMSKNEWPGPSMVWVSIPDRLVLREEIRTSAKIGDNLTETKRTTFIDQFNVDQALSENLFDIKA